MFPLFALAAIVFIASMNIMREDKASVSWGRPVQVVSGLFIVGAGCWVMGLWLLPVLAGFIYLFYTVYHSWKNEVDLSVPHSVRDEARRAMKFNTVLLGPRHDGRGHIHAAPG